MSGDRGKDAVPPFRVETVDYAMARHALHAVRDAVFVHEQRVPVDLEHDDLDPGALHVLARTPDGEPVGAARLVPPQRGAYERLPLLDQRAVPERPVLLWQYDERARGIRGVFLGL